MNNNICRWFAIFLPSKNCSSLSIYLSFSDFCNVHHELYGQGVFSNLCGPSSLTAIFFYIYIIFVYFYVSNLDFCWNRYFFRSNFSYNHRFLKSYKNFSSFRILLCSSFPTSQHLPTSKSFTNRLSSNFSRNFLCSFSSNRRLPT